MSVDKKKKNDRFHDLLMQQRKHHLESSKYANQRIDIVLVTISSAAALLCSDLIQEGENDCLLATKTSLMLFLLTIVSNLISQVTSKLAHDKDEEYTEYLIRDNSNIKGGNETKEPIYLNFATSLFNYLSWASFIIAMFLLGFSIVS